MRHNQKPNLGMLGGVLPLHTSCQNYKKLPTPSPPQMPRLNVSNAQRNIFLFQLWPNLARACNEKLLQMIAMVLLWLLPSCNGSTYIVVTEGRKSICRTNTPMWEHADKKGRDFGNTLPTLQNFQI